MQLYACVNNQLLIILTAGEEHCWDNAQDIVDETGTLRNTNILP